MLRTAFALALLAFAASCTTTPAPPRDAVSDLAPTGKLRAAINFGNPVLASKDPSGGEPRGVSVDLSRELARRLGVPLELVTYDAAGKVVASISSGAWDVAYLAIDPQRALELAYSPPYVIIEGAYVVRDRSPIRVNDDVDKPGARIAVGAGSVYDLYLSRELKHATLVRAPTSQAVTDEFVRRELDVAAGVRQQLESDMRRVPGLRLLDGRFMVINQAMATPRAREAGARYLREFVEQMKASGFVADALARHAIDGAKVAPAGDAR